MHACVVTQHLCVCARACTATQHNKLNVHYHTWWNNNNAQTDLPQ